MKNKSLLTLLAATTAFSGVAVVSQPANTEAASSAKNQVTKAEKLAQKLAAEINYDKRKKQYPKSPVGLPNAKIYKDTKTAYSQALAAVKKAKGSEKKVLQARLDSKVKPTLNRTATYITAVNAGAKLLTESYALDKNVKAYKLDSKTEKNYKLVSASYAKLTKQINSVYGSSTRISLNKAYTYKIAPIYKKARFAFQFQSNLDELAQAIKTGDQAKVKSCKNLADKLIADNKKYKYANVTTALYKQLIADYSALAAQLDDKVTTYKALSKDAANPTVFGGTATQPVTINHDVIIEAGEGTYVKLQNVIVNGNIIVKGDATGAGTVTLDQVQVNKTQNVSGQIIVQDVATHSLYLNGVKAFDVVVNDPNGSHIVSQNGTQVGNLIVLENAGAQGTVTLESQGPSSFNQITVSPKGSANSGGVNLKGDFSNSKVSVNGEGQKVNMTAGTTVKELEVTSKAQISTEPGAQVLTVTISAANKDQEIVISGNVQKVVIIGEGGKVTVAPGATIKEIEVKSNATISAAPGSTVGAVTVASDKQNASVTLSGSLQNTVVNVQNSNAAISVPTGSVVGEIKKDAAVTGTVKVDNQGTINKAGEGLQIIVNPTPPVGGETPVTPLAISNISATLSSGGSSSYNNSNKTVTLTGASTAQLTNITLTAQKPGFTIKLKSLTGSNGVILPLSHSFSSGANSSSVSIGAYNILPIVGPDGVSLGMLSRALGGGATISLDLTDGSTTIPLTVPLVINITSGTTPAFVNNGWLQFTRAGSNPEIVTAKILQPTAKIASAYNLPTNVDDTTAFAALFAGLTTVGLDTKINFDGSTTWLSVTDPSIVTTIKNMTGNKPWGDITFDDLSNDSIWFKTADNKTYQLKFVK